MGNLYVSLDGQVLTVKKVLSKNETYKIKNRKGIFGLSIFKKPTICKGISSLCKDMKHVLFLDYDTISWEILRSELFNLIDTFKLSPFYVFETKEGQNYHAICLTKMTATKVREVINASNCDAVYNSMPVRKMSRSWVLRTSTKRDKKSPFFRCVVGTKNISNIISTPHLKFLKEFYGVPDMKYPHQDNSTKFFYDIYETGG